MSICFKFNYSEYNQNHTYKLQQENYYCLSTFNNYKSQHELLHVSIHEYDKEKKRQTHNECKMK